MNKPHLTSATVLPKLRGILLEDIEALPTLLPKSSKGSELSALLESLMSAKQMMVAIIPSYEHGLDGVPTPNSSTRVTSYKGLTPMEEKDQVKMISLLCKVEEGQFSFIQNAIGAEGMPKALQSKLIEIMEMSSSIVDQLRRMNSTANISTIVI